MYYDLFDTQMFFFLRGLNSSRNHIPTLLYVYITMQVGSCGTESLKWKKNIAKLLIGPEYKQNRTPYHDHHISVWLQIHLLKKEILASDNVFGDNFLLDNAN